MSDTYPSPGLELVGVVNPQIVALVTQFSAHLLTFLTGQPGTWANTTANLTPTDALLLKIPINVFALDGYEEWTGTRNYIDVDLVAQALAAKPWTRNLKYSMRAAMTGVYGGFPQMAANTVAESYKMKPRIAGSILKLGSTKALTYQGIPLFVASSAGTKHFVNPLDKSKGTFFNLCTGTVVNPATGGEVSTQFGADSFAAAQAMLSSIPGPDGVESLGLELTHVLGGTTMRDPFRRLLKKATILGATTIANITLPSGAATQALASQETNIYFDDAIPMVGSQLNSDPYLIENPNGQVWYAIACNTMARPVEMMGLNGGAPVVKVYGEESELANQAKSVLINGDMEMNGAAGMPHTIIRFEWPGN